VIKYGMQYNCTDFIANWTYQQIFYIFSKETFLKGSAMITTFTNKIYQ